MSSPRSLTGPRRWRRRAVRLMLALAMAAAIWGMSRLGRKPPVTLDGLATVTARRADLRSTLLVGGQTESAANTVVECELERLEMRSQGRSSAVGGSSTITWVIDDGAMVKKGDLLCTLDSSDYEELVRQQEIKVERARADLRASELGHNVARLALQEFRDGLMAQTIQQDEVALALAESEIERWKARAAWIERMKSKGYASTAMVSSAEIARRQAEIDASAARTNLDLFRRYGAPNQIRTLEADIRSAEADLIYQRLRTRRTDEQLAYYKKMVDRCTIRAPHDGLVIYAPPRLWSSDAPIEAGSRVRQNQDLFLLPDLSRMRVLAKVHESIVERVRPGMRAHATIEGLSGRRVEGHVLEVDPLPDAQTSWLSDTRSFKATIALDAPPRGLRPEMTAEVEIDVDRREDVVTIPVSALAVESGRDYCYVASGGLLERRPVVLGRSNPDMLEVAEGLEEGEEVVGDVSGIEAYAPLIVDSPHPTADAPAPAFAEVETETPESSAKAGF